MQIKPLILILFILILQAGSATAQNLDWNITGAGARAAGFGGAFIGVADDATSVVWNPAGLATLERPELSAVTRYIMESFETNLTDATGAHFTKTTDLSHTVFNFASAAYPLHLGETKLVLAAAYQRQLDFWGSQARKNWTFDSEGGGDTFTPGLGIRLLPVLALGASANIWFGSANGTIEQPATTRSWDQTFSGFNLVFGALADFGSSAKPIPLKLGVSLRTPFDLSEDKSAGGVTQTTTDQMPLMLGFGASYRSGDNFTLAADYEMRQFGDSKMIAPNGDEKPISQSGEDLNQIRAGAEYLIISDIGIFPVRAGFQTVPTVRANYDADHPDLDGNFPVKDQVTGTGFALGTGYIAERFAFDATYSQRQYKQENDPNGQIGKETVTSSVITLSGIVYF